MSEPNCPDCQVEMEAGFLPDQNYNCAFQVVWHRGEAEESQSFGGLIKHGIKYDKKETAPVTAYRCPECGLLRLYANEADKG